MFRRRVQPAAPVAARGGKLISAIEQFRYDDKQVLVVGGATGVGVHQPEQMGNAMVFLNSDAPSGINGVNLLVDSGHVMSSTTGSFAAGKPIIDLLMGRLTLA